MLNYGNTAVYLALKVTGTRNVLRHSLHHLIPIKF